MNACTVYLYNYHRHYWVEIWKNDVQQGGDIDCRTLREAREVARRECGHLGIRSYEERRNVKV